MSGYGLSRTPSSMNAPKAFIMPPELWRSASEEERTEYEILYLEHLRLIEKGKVVVFMPGGWGTRFQNSGVLHTIAQDICERVSANVLIHYLTDTSVFRIGPIIDYEDQQATEGGILCFEIRITSPQANLVDLKEDSYEHKFHKIAKPRNMWILYRQEKHREVAAQHPEMHTSEISKIISSMWQNEPPLIRQQFKRLAEQEKARHQEKHPGYKCCPRKSSQIKKRKPQSKFLHLSRSTSVANTLTAAPFATEYPSTKATYSDGIDISPIFNLDHSTPYFLQDHQCMVEPGFSSHCSISPWETMVSPITSNDAQSNMQTTFDEFEDSYRKCVSAHQNVKYTHQDIENQFELDFEAGSQLLSFDTDVDNNEGHISMRDMKPFRQE